MTLSLINSISISSVFPLNIKKPPFTVATALLEPCTYLKISSNLFPTVTPSILVTISPIFKSSIFAKESFATVVITALSPINLVPKAVYFSPPKYFIIPELKVAAWLSLSFIDISRMAIKNSFSEEGSAICGKISTRA
ncbi:hypothetical protein D3C85_1191590 [compost metagenome]